MLHCTLTDPYDDCSVNNIEGNVPQGLLNYMVGGSSEDVTRDTVEVLQHAGLMARYSHSDML